MKALHYNIKNFPQKMPSLEYLIRLNKRFKEEFKHNPLFKLIKAGFFNSEDRREALLDYLQIWSNYFQRIMLLKTALCDDPLFVSIFQQHLEEELGHDELLKKDRARIINKKDVILEALCNWFFSKMFTFSPYEQVVVINLCLEAAAVVFYDIAKPSIDPNNQLKYFQAHANVDECHEEMGLRLLEGLSGQQYLNLMNRQEESWQVMNAMMQRISELLQKEVLPHKKAIAC